ncbi:hypothetical protein GGTG_09901 [Gaeumannomyces tritici R3-111a-1]|uniref:DUF676 domain-containing protein n=1 Tax=Gaeumannomyces tritici (strain R3-111a-1) TaxID=644352 RepID=J3P8R6_GAET3|nr:hypothetical protein GGTG_09901 [Gaeumannomyces tritici R3-111a-1]EJT73050.1 hypothetical protein GGTG_09901 [Gaeumannomyces tritici R3-111a-1]
MAQDGVAEALPSPRGAGDKRVSGPASKHQRSPKPNPWRNKDDEAPCTVETAHGTATSPLSLPPPPAASAPPSSAAPRVIDRVIDRTRAGRAAEQRGAVNPDEKTLADEDEDEDEDEPCDDYKTKHHPLPALQQFCATPLGLLVANNAISLYALFTMDTVIECSGGTPEADHLCVLVHGLWGNPAHLAQVAKALRDQYPVDKVWIKVANRNSGSFTYDGIELGGERLCLEIEEELQLIESKGGKIKKLSLVGYSLGGLVARYAIGLLHAKGILDQVECMNFTAFASPFLGVRTPLKGWANHVWNVLGARTLSISGRQLFGIDKFRNTGRPLLSVLTDPNSIFMSGLRRFKRHTLYSNIVNDRAAVYYTTGITKTDPYVDLDKIRPRYVQGYEDVILDPISPFSPRPPSSQGPDHQPGSRALKWLKRVPFFVALAIFVPIGVLAFLVNSAIQTVRSSKRVKAHNRGLTDVDISVYRVLPLWIKEMRGAVEDAYENLNSSQNQEFLGSASDEDDSETEGAPPAAVQANGDSTGTNGTSGANGASKKRDSEKRCNGDAGAAAAAEVTPEEEEEAEGEAILALERKQSHPGQPTLALAPYQFKMIESLDTLKWHKYPVWIHKNNHSHAAIIVRTVKPSFDEGYVVLRHWLNEEFII